MKHPPQYGFRGDIGLWDEFITISIDITIPKSAQRLENELYILFEKITGHKPIYDKCYYIERFDQGGMSRGLVACDFWLGKGFATIIKRYFDHKHPLTKIFYRRYRKAVAVLDKNFKSP